MAFRLRLARWAGLLAAVALAGCAAPGDAQTAPAPDRSTAVPATATRPAATAPEQTAGPPVLPTADPNRPPPIRLRVDGQIYEGIEGSYCYGGLCVDKVAPALTTYQPFRLGQPIEIVVDGPAPDEVFLDVLEGLDRPAVFSAALDPGAPMIWTPAVAPGSYVLAVFARWTPGDVVYFFGVALS